MRFLIHLFILAIVTTGCRDSLEKIDSNIKAGSDAVVLSGLWDAANTRGTIVDSDILKSNPFGVMMYGHTNVNPTSSNSFNVTKSKPDYAFNVSFSYVASKELWATSDENVNWPDYSGNINAGLSFFTYYPYIDDADQLEEYGYGTEFELLTDKNSVGSPRFRYVAGEEPETHQDILIGDPVDLLNRFSVIGATHPISFDFAHILSSIVFSREVKDISAEHDPSATFRFRIKEVTISGLYNGGKFKAKTDTSSPTLITRDMEWSDYVPTTQDGSFYLAEGVELLEATDDGQGAAEMDKNYLVSKNGAVIFIPPHTAADLKIVVKAEISENVIANGVTTDEIISDELIIEKSIANHIFRQGERYNFSVEYKYTGPIEGQIDIIGKISPWEVVEAIVPPYI